MNQSYAKNILSSPTFSFTLWQFVSTYPATSLLNTIGCWWFYPFPVAIFSLLNHYSFYNPKVQIKLNNCDVWNQQKLFRFPVSGILTRGLLPQWTLDIWLCAMGHWILRLTDKEFIGIWGPWDLGSCRDSGGIVTSLG